MMTTKKLEVRRQAKAAKAAAFGAKYYNALVERALDVCIGRGVAGGGLAGLKKRR